MYSYLGNGLILFFAARGVKGKIGFLSYLLKNLAARLHLVDLRNKEFRMIFKDVTFWVGAVSGELGAYIQMYVKNVDEKAEGFVPSSGDIILDIGGNIGLYAVKNSRRVGGRGKIWVFEPNPAVFGRLLKNLKENNATNVVAIQKAVSSENGKMDFAVASGITPEGKIQRHKECGRGSQEFIEIDCVTLDDFVSENHLDEINLAKIDVEGEEFEALKGAKAKTLPLVEKIVLEYHGEEERNNCVSFLKDHGFDLALEDDKNRVLYFRKRKD